MGSAAIPNALSAARAVLAPFIGWALLRGAYELAFALLVLAGVTDGLDGYLARRLHASSQAGAYLDPIADKVLVSVVVICLAWRGDLPWWLVALIFGRDVLILAGAAAMRAFAGLREFPPSLWGKVATALNVVTVGTVIFAGIGVWAWVDRLAAGLIWIAAAATVWSGLHYAWLSARRLRALHALHASHH